MSKMTIQLYNDTDKEGESLTLSDKLIKDLFLDQESPFVIFSLKPKEKWTVLNKQDNKRGRLIKEVLAMGYGYLRDHMTVILDHDKNCTYEFNPRLERKVLVSKEGIVYFRDFDKVHSKRNNYICNSNIEEILKYLSSCNFSILDTK